ncbi:HEPN domain-containing protein [Pedobacter polaris]|uniref:HEPN domain-containing protein n=1 Tax=Pedobacter polaris TaxID=2571273 RepID=A0A4U1CTK4_9SPHI|nr:HEPN domain-containing protein [Pedobacter polaris]TKC10420.1 HEPN domain-containing protein [Pedobacter polaris]
MKPKQILILDYEKELNSLFRYYPTELIESSLLPLLPPDDEINEHMSITHLFYAELNYITQRCLASYQQNYKDEEFDEENYTLKDLSAIVKILKEIIPVGYIFYHCASTNNCSLTIVLDQYLYKPLDDIQSLVNFTLLAYPNISCAIHAYSTMANMITQCHFYYATLCIRANCIYQRSTDFMLPKPNLIYLAENQLKTKTEFKHHTQKATNFFEGAKSFLDNQEHGMAAFMLQQACEFSLRSLIVAFKGKDFRSHELLVLRKHALHYCPGLMGLFNPIQRKELHLFTILEEAYIKARYESTYQIDELLLTTLFNATANLIIGVQQLFEEWVKKAQATTV